MANPQCKIEQRTKAILPCGIALDLAANVADDAAKSRAQEFEFPPSALELVGMRIAPHHNGRAFGHAQITLAQLDASPIVPAHKPHRMLFANTAASLALVPLLPRPK